MLKYTKYIIKYISIYISESVSHRIFFLIAEPKCHITAFQR